MNVSETCRQRKSIRSFSDKTPEKGTILQCLEAAAWAPNPTGRQPWQFVVLSGASLQKACGAIAERFANAQAERAAQSAPQLSADIAAVIEKRGQETFSAMISHLEEHQADMQALGEGNFNFHGAPMAILFGTWPCKDDNFLKSTVAAMQSFMLAACEAGLGTCWMNAVSICQDAIKEALDLHPDLILVDGVAVGYPDSDAPVNDVPRSRLPIEDVVRWLA
jgi:nitroreductase